MTGPTTLSELHERASRPNPGVLQTLRDSTGDFVVIGAGGKMGLHLTAMLQRGLREIGSAQRVLAVSRFAQPGSTHGFQHYGIDTLPCDLLDDGAVESLPDAGSIFFLAGVKFGTRNDPQLLRDVNVELPRRIAQRYGDSRIVALSTGCVYAFVPVSGGGSIESDEPQPAGAYAQSCLGREQSFAAGQAPATLVRLNYSVDLRYGVLVDIANRVYNEQAIDVTTGVLNFIWQGDANSYIIRSLSAVSRPPRVLNVTGAGTWRVREIAEQFGRMFDKPVSFTGSEADTAWLSNAKLCHNLFGPPEVDEPTLIRWVADWLIAGGPLLGKPTHFEIRDGSF